MLRFRFGLLLATLLVLNCISLSAQQSFGSGGGIEEELELARKLREESKGSELPGTTDVSVMGREIKLTKSLIVQFETEIELNSQRIAEAEETICQLQDDLDDIRSGYARTARATYKSLGKQNFWVLLFSAKNLTDAFYRAIYYRQYIRYRASQINLIRQAQFFLEMKSKDLERRVTEKRDLLSRRGKASTRLIATESEQKQLMTEIKKRGTTARTIPTPKINLLESGTNPDPEAGIDKGSFEKSRGGLAWPVPSREAFIVTPFGTSEDAFGNQVVNDGVQIRTVRGQEVRSVYQGVVTGVQPIPLGGEVVIIQHGSYRTVYDNLTDVVVQVGQKVNSRDLIGKVRTDPRTGETLLHFLIYKTPDKFVDPARWLLNRR